MAKNIEDAVERLIRGCDTPEAALQAVVPQVNESAYAAFFAGKLFNKFHSFEVDHSNGNLYVAFGLDPEEMNTLRAEIAGNVAYKASKEKRSPDTRSLIVEAILNKTSDPLKIATLAVTFAKRLKKE